jgi:hypothetical protein
MYSAIAVSWPKALQTATPPSSRFGFTGKVDKNSRNIFLLGGVCISSTSQLAAGIRLPINLSGLTGQQVISPAG